MATEKRGATGQLKYDFNTKWSTEVQLEKNGKWYRATCREFRSFDGPRRIYVKNEETGIYEYVSYRGPLYLFDTNTRLTRKYNRKFRRETARIVKARKHEEKWNL